MGRKGAKPHVGEARRHRFIAKGGVDPADDGVGGRPRAFRPPAPADERRGHDQKVRRQEDRQRRAGHPPGAPAHPLQEAGNARKRQPNEQEPQRAPDQGGLQADPAAEVQEVLAVVPGEGAEAPLLEEAAEVFHGRARRGKGQELLHRMPPPQEHGEQIDRHGADAVDDAERPPDRRGVALPMALADDAPKPLEHKACDAADQEQPKQGRIGDLLLPDRLGARSAGGNALRHAAFHVHLSHFSGFSPRSPGKREENTGELFAKG